MPNDSPQSAVAPQKLLLFVHGLAGSATKTWGIFDSLIKADPSLGDHSAKFFSYSTAWFRLPFMARSARIQELARSLQTYIKYNCRDFSEIVLITHSMGGLIAKRYLLDELTLGRLDARIKGLMLYAVPHNGSSLASVSSLVSWGHHQVAQLQPYSDVLDALSNEWSRSGLESVIRTIYVIGALDQIVDPRSASAFPGNFKIETLADKNHRSICKPNNIGDLTYKIFRHFVLECTLISGSVTTEYENSISDLKTKSAQPAARVDDVLFYVYSRLVEPWYLKRADDANLAASATAMSVWASGPTGTGKTAAIQRFVDFHGHAHTYVSLASYRGYPLVDLLRAIATTLISILGGQEDHPVKDLPNLIRRVAELLCRLSREQRFYLFVEELPLDREDEFRAFIDMTYSLFIELGKMRPRNPISLLFSSINDPLPYVNGNFDKIHERMRFVHFGAWLKEDCGALVDLIASSLAVEVSPEDRSLIIDSCRGSPRFIKALFRMAAGRFFPGASIGELVVKAADEVFPCA